MSAMKTAVLPRCSLLALLFTVLLAPQAAAQYMYLDLKAGPGASIKDHGPISLDGSRASTQEGTPVSIDIWLNSGSNRDGSPAACADTRFNSYSVVLHAQGGAVTYSSYTGSGTLRTVSPTDAYIDGPSSTIHAGSLLKLGTVNLYITGPVTDIQIAPSTPLVFNYFTSIGSPCDGVRFDNTLRLGEDWFDADGTGPPTILGGQVFMDPEGDAVSPCAPGPGESGLGGRRVQLNPGGKIAYTNNSGAYYFTVAPGNYTLTLLDDPQWAQSCPSAGAPLSYTIAEGQLIQDANFGIAPIGTVKDLVIASASGPARPGFIVTYSITADNVGNTTLPSASISFAAPPELAQPPVSISDGGQLNGGTVEWPSIQMIPGQRVWRSVSYQVPVSTPIGTILTATAMIGPTVDDATPADNTALVSTIVRGSYDPNEKLVTPSGRILRTASLHYHVGFQNVGTDTAFTVVVRDTIDAGLDLATFRSGASRHPYTLELNGRKIIWKFAGIDLPDSNASEPNSHGFFEYTIQPSTAAPDGALLRNFADIYFDFNSAVTTNTTVNTIDSPPILQPVPDITVDEGSTADQPLSGTDAEGDALTFTLVSGAAWASVTTVTPTSGNLHLAPQLGDNGTSTVTTRASDGLLSDDQSATVNVSIATGVAMAETFAEQEIQLAGRSSEACIRLDASSGAFRTSDIDPSTLVLRSSGTGTASQIQAHRSRPAAGGGSSPGGIGGTEICFASDEVRTLFARLVDTRRVSVTCEGRLKSGEPFSGMVPLTVLVSPGRLSASFTPNPFNPSAVLRFRTVVPGYARVKLYGMNGRLVRTLLDTPTLDSGYHDMFVDGRDDMGRRLGSGLYFYKIDTAGGSQIGRITLLK
jgi:Big-like domain-containing protein